MVTIEEFQKIDLRIGEIIEVEDHPNADKLYVLKVKIGEEIRTIVAGIKRYYKKEELKGKKVVIVYNLEPKEIRGVRSEGMLLAADDGKNVVLIVPDRDIKTGAKIR